MTSQNQPDKPCNVAGLDLLGRKEVSKRINRTVRGLEELMKKDQTFPRPKRWGKSFAWRAEDVDAWAKAQFAATSEENAARLKGGAK